MFLIPFLSSCVLLSQSEEAPVAPSARGGLILARSLYDGFEPQPAAFILARPAPSDAGGQAAEWSLETVQEAASEVVAQLGFDANGERVFCEVDPKGERIGAPFRWTHDDDGWGREPVEETDGWEWELRGGRPFARRFQVGGGTVFHQARWFEPIYGEPGILTLSANLSYLKLWRLNTSSTSPAGPVETRWSPEVLWSAAVGRTDQRFRDLEVGDVDGDGVDELVLVTHDLGQLFVLEQTEAGLVPKELPRAGADLGERVFIHEVELAQLDEDPALEIVITPSAPNRADGKAQPGNVERYDYAPEGYRRTVLASWPERHAKEVLAADLDGSGRHRLFCALEGNDSSQGVLLELPREASEESEPTEIFGYGGPHCRFLAVGDLLGEGTLEIVAATGRVGLQAFAPTANGWERRVIAPGYLTAGPEHALAVFDWDGNGRADVFTASDPPVGPPRLQRFEWDPRQGRFAPHVLAQWDRRERFLTWFLAPLPAGR